MNYENIKKGDHVLIPGVVQREPEGEYLYVTYQCGINRNGLEYFRMADVSKYLIFPPENGTKNTEPSPKYDPCREFRIGDVVRVRKIHGNLPQCRYNGMVKVKEGDCCTIHDKEHRNCYWITTPSGDNWCFDIAYFELVTPVEGYFQVEGDEDEQEFYVVKGARFVASYGYGPDDFYKKEEAKAAAEAECARLNAEHRKEQTNG